MKSVKQGVGPRAAWERALAGADPAAAAAVHRALEARWCEPHRAYHTLAHLAHVLAVVADLERAGEPVTDPSAVVLAAWYHDAVYDPLSGGNEAASADLARLELAGLGVDPAPVADLVLATADHRPTGPDAAVLIDADLAILATPAPRYAAYAAAVRAEYAAVPDDAWRAGRAAVLQDLLARAHLYATRTMRARAEQAARANLAAELAGLSADR